MWARSRKLNLASVSLTGPLLIPSISSKGFPIIDGKSEAGKALQFAAPDLTESLLISAYDLHYDLLPGASRLLGPDHSKSLYGHPALLVIDSGGYELDDDFESGETNRGSRKVHQFGRVEFEGVVDRLPTDRDLLVVTFDHELRDSRQDYREQRRQAQAFAARHRQIRIDCLLKPPAGDEYIEPRKIVADAPNLHDFDAIGVTEKDLGGPILDRLTCLARLREVLDESGAQNVPIHVFGGLSPGLTRLYFMAGAEIFDGLSWLKYAYHGDSALHPDEVAVLEHDIDSAKLRRDARRLMSNLHALTDLKHCLERWAHEPDRYEVLGRHHLRLREIYETLRARLRKVT